MELMVSFGLIAGLGITCIILGIKIKLLEEKIVELYSWKTVISNVCTQLVNQDKRSQRLFAQIYDLDQVTIKRLNTIQDYILAMSNQLLMNNNNTEGDIQE